MLRIANRLLRTFGLKLVPAPQPKPVFYPPSPQERQQINQILAEFAQKQDPSKKAISSADEWASYLTDVRLSFFDELLAVVRDHQVSLKDKSIADFGSGTGYLFRLIHRDEPSAKLTGFDTFEAANQLAQIICPTANYVFDFDSNQDCFDIIFCTEVLEHLKYPREQVHKFVSRLNREGRLVLKVPNGRVDTHISKNEREDGTGYWGHINFWSPESWQLFLEDALGDSAKIETGLMRSGGNYAIVSMLN